MASAVTSAPLQVLLVEDETMPRAITTHQITSACGGQVRIIHVDTAEDALKALTGKPFQALSPDAQHELHSPIRRLDLTIMDNQMPPDQEHSAEPDQGILVTKMLREEEDRLHLPHVPVVAHSSDEKSKFGSEFTAVWPKSSPVHRIAGLLQQLRG